MDLTPPTKIEWIPSQKEFADRISFLSLPRELRDLIYEFAFRISGAIFIYSADPKHIRRNARAVVVRNKNEGPLEPQPASKMITIALMRICRQVHAESSGILFGHNHFRLYASNADFAPRYGSLVRHIIFTTDSMMQKIFEDDLETVDYWWRRHFWPDILSKSTRLLQTYPCLDTLTFRIKSSRPGETWRPAFMASDQKTRDQRISLAAAWLKIKCPLELEKLRHCLQLEIVPAAGYMKDDYEGSRFSTEEEWDSSEFTEAFEKMKAS